MIEKTDKDYKKTDFFCDITAGLTDKLANKWKHKKTKSFNKGVLDSCRFFVFKINSNT